MRSSTNGKKQLFPKSIAKIKAITPEIIFPLARQDEKHNIGQIFDWAPERNQNLSRSANHQLFVLRLRDEITASASLHLVQYVSEVNQQVNTEIRWNFRSNYSQLAKPFQKRRHY